MNEKFDKNNQKLKEIYEAWVKARDEDEKFLLGRLYWNLPFFNKTVEGLSAYKTYRSLCEEERATYALYSSHLYDIFFSLSEEEISEIERTLPPYPYILEMVGRSRNISQEELEILKGNLGRNPFKSILFSKKRREILEKYGLITEEYRSIVENRELSDWKDFIPSLAVLYGGISTGIYLQTSNPLPVFLYLLTFPIPYQIMRYISLKKRDIKKFLDKPLFASFLFRSPIGFLLSVIEFGLISPLISKIIERCWYSDYFPDSFRKTIYKTHTFLLSLKARKFDEREIRKLLYDMELNSSNISRHTIDRFKEEVENGLVEIEDPRKSLLNPWTISWYRRRVVAIQKDKEVDIIDKEFVKKLARIEGVSEERMERRIKRYPMEYLGCDLWNDKLVYTRDIIGVLPCRILEALVYKEGYTALLARKSDEIIEEKILMEKIN